MEAPSVQRVSAPRVSLPTGSGCSQDAAVPVAASVRRTPCTVQSTVSPPGDGPERPGPRRSPPGLLRPREKVAGVRCELHALPRAPACPRRPETLRRPPPQAGPAPAAPRHGRSPGCVGGAAGGGTRPPYHLHLAGVELAGGRGHRELDLLAVLRVHGGRGGRQGWGRAFRGPGLRSGFGFPALLGARRRALAVRCEGEASGSRSDKNTARCEGRAREREGVAPAQSAPNSRIPGSPAAPAAAWAPGSRARGLCPSP